MLQFVREQRIQVSGGFRLRIVSVTPDEGNFDSVLVVEPEGDIPYSLRLLVQPIIGGPQHMVMASELCQLRPELLH